MEFAKVQQYLVEHGLDAWICYDFRNINEYFIQLFGRRHTTRRVFLVVPAHGTPALIVSFVDAGKFPEPDLQKERYVTREDLIDRLGAHLADKRRVAMEYSPGGALPAASYVDGGTLDIVRSFGVDVVSSADLYQYAYARWSPEGLASHRRTAEQLVAIVKRAFGYVGDHVGTATEFEVAEFIREQFRREGLYAEDGPIVAVNEHSGDPHYEPCPSGSSTIRPGDWVLIDLWACQPGSIYGDITWCANLGPVPERRRQVFDIVAGARDRAFNLVAERFRRGEPVEGWEVDQAARQHITEQGYGIFFTHRLGHSLGHRVHANGVNVDNFETHDTRRIIPGVGFTIEPGIYLPEFGARSEVDVFVGENGPELTTEAQRAVVII